MELLPQLMTRIFIVLDDRGEGAFFLVVLEALVVLELLDLLGILVPLSFA